MDEQKKKLLIVDDSLSNLKLFCSLMEDSYDIICATNGKEGIMLAKENMPDMILLDVMMPELDGYEVCKILREDPYTHRIPIMFLTVLDHIEDQEKGLEMGAIDYIAKPFHPRSMRMKIKNYLDFIELLKVNTN